MQPQVSIITAIAPYHSDIAQAAILSAQAQTVPVTIITAYDEHLRGAGFARNRALERVTTEFVTFLDADDTIKPTFVERCLSVWQPNHYVYSDWLEDTTRKDAPDCPYTNKTWHPITTLIPTTWVKRVGGFNEALMGAEDTELYLKLLTSGCCGLHLKEPLFHYGAQGRRAKQFMQSPAYHETMERFSREFGSKQMACCGNNVPLPETPADGMAGDILVQAMWAGNQQRRGMISGRLYPRTSYPHQLNVDPRDAEAMPHLFRRVERDTLPPMHTMIRTERVEPAVEKWHSRPLNGVKEVAGALWNTPVPWSSDELLAIQPAEVKPDVGALARLVGKTNGH